MTNHTLRAYGKCWYHFYTSSAVVKVVTLSYKTNNSHQKFPRIDIILKQDLPIWE